jgi:hypothetical protein
MSFYTNLQKSISPGRILLAMASSVFFTNGILPRHQKSDQTAFLRLLPRQIFAWRNFSPWPSQWRSGLVLSGSPRHLARLWLAMASWPLPKFVVFALA